MSANPLVAWFDYLSAIHDHALNISHLADTDSRKFVRQKPATILPTPQLQDSMGSFLDSHFSQRVPQQTFNVATFRAFIEALIGSRDVILRSLFYSVAVNHQPAILELSLAKFGAAKPKDALAKPEAREELFTRIDSATPTSFFPPTLDNRNRIDALLENSTSVDEVVRGSLL